MNHVYLRVAEHDLARTRTQHDACRAFIDAKRVDGVTRIVQEVCGGNTDPRYRPVLGQILRTVQRGDSLIVTSADRIAKTAYMMLRVVEYLNKLGVTLYVVDMDGTFEPEPVASLFNPMGLMKDDTCRKCGKVIGFGYEATHRGVCGACVTVETEMN